MNNIDKILNLDEAMTIQLSEIVAQSIVDPKFLNYVRNGDAGGIVEYLENNYPTNYNESYQLSGKFLNDPAYIKRICDRSGVAKKDFTVYYNTLINGWWTGSEQY